MPSGERCSFYWHHSVCTEKPTFHMHKLTLCLGINAFAYMTVARMVYFGLPEKKIWGVRAIKLTVLFVWLDIICFLVQLGGGALLSNNNDANLTKIGMKVYTAGIGLQLGFVVIFGFMTGWFYYRMQQVSRGGSMGRLRLLTWTMLAVLVLIMVSLDCGFLRCGAFCPRLCLYPRKEGRCCFVLIADDLSCFQVRIIFRLLEFGPGLNASNKLITDETYPLVLDAMPMAIALALLNLMHPGLVLRGPDGEFPRMTRREKKEAKRLRKEEKQRLKEEKRRSKRGTKGKVYDEELGEGQGPVPDTVVDDGGDDGVRLAEAGMRPGTGTGSGTRGHYHGCQGHHNGREEDYERHAGGDSRRDSGHGGANVNTVDGGWELTRMR